MIKVVKEKTTLEGSFLELVAEYTALRLNFAKDVAETTDGKITEAEIEAMVGNALQAAKLMDSGMSPEEAYEVISGK